MPSVWSQIKNRRIFRVATYYAAFAWGIIQIADILLPVLNYPDWIMASMVLVGFTGFPIAMIFGWLIDIKLEREAYLAKTSSASPTEEASNLKPQGYQNFKHRLIELFTILLFAAGAAFLYVYSNKPHLNQQNMALPSVQKLTQSVSGQKTIAVLPFTSFGGSADDGYFADGLSEELLNVLAKNKQLRVAARTSSFQYKNKNLNIKTIAEELGVQYILEGSVRRSGDLIRVTAQLIKADEDVHIFSSSWDKNVSNIFKVQDEIAQSVLNRLEIQLLGKNDSNKTEIGTQDIAAFAEYARGVSNLRNRGKADFLQAIVHFNRALEIDPDYAAVEAYLAEAYLLQASYGLIEIEKAIRLAEPHIEKALSLAPELAEGHAVKGLYHWQLANLKVQDKEASQSEFKRAKIHLNRAIELNPSNAEAYMWYGSILQLSGQAADGSKLFEKAFEIDPQAAVVGFNRASDLVSQGRYDEAMQVFNTIVRHNPNYANAYSIAGDIYYAKGELDKAYFMYQKIAEISDGSSEWMLSANRIFVAFGMWEQAQQNIDAVAKSGNFAIKRILPSLQAQLWLASQQDDQFNQWIESLNENSDNWADHMWRGFSLVKQGQWQYAIDALEKSLTQYNESMNLPASEISIRINLMLANASKNLGAQFKMEGYLEKVQQQVDYLLSHNLRVAQLMKYYQASHAAISNKPLIALGLLREAIQQGFSDVWLLKIDPSFDSLAGDPTFNTLIREFESKLRLMRLNIEPKVASH